MEKQSIFYPETELIGNPGRYGLPFEDVVFASGGFRLHGWFVPGERSIAWLWCHGNAGNISHRLENLSLLRARLAVSVFIFDYRGYGRSQGEPSEAGTYADAHAALSYLRSRPDVKPDRIVFFGRSLGAAVALELATHEPCFGLILESPFTSVADMTRAILPFTPRLPLSTAYDSLSRIGTIHAPLLILHGHLDEVVPIGQGRLLYQAANGPKRFYTIAGAGHNDTYIVGGDKYFAALDTFISRLERDETGPAES